jgi:DNA-binding protein H-NS
MEDYKKLIQEREALSSASAARQDAISGAIAKIQSLIAEFELTPQDVFPRTQPQHGGGHQGGAQIPRSRHGPDVDRAWQAAQVDSGSGSRQIRDLICICSL